VSRWIATDTMGWINADQIFRLDIGETEDGAMWLISAHRTIGPSTPVQLFHTREEADGRLCDIMARLGQSGGQVLAAPSDEALGALTRRVEELKIECSEKAALAKRLREENAGNARGLNQWNERYVKERRTNERLRAENEENAEGRDYWNDLYLKQRKEFERLVARLEKENAELRGASSDHTRSCPCFEDQRFDDPSQEERP